MVHVNESDGAKRCVEKSTFRSGPVLYLISYSFSSIYHYKREKTQKHTCTHSLNFTNSE